jgi:hypothetical protein
VLLRKIGILYQTIAKNARALQEIFTKCTKVYKVAEKVQIAVYRSPTDKLLMNNEVAASG